MTNYMYDPKLGYQQNRLGIYTPVLFLGGNYWINDSISANFGITGITVSSKYAKSPIDGMPIGTFGNNKLTSLSAIFSPGITIKVSDNQAYSITGLIGYSTLKTNIATDNGLLTSGYPKLDSATGAGIKVGGVWGINGYFSFGANMSSPVRFNKYKKYTDVMPYPNSFPAIAMLGVNIQATPRLNLLLDFKRIYYKWERIYNNLQGFNNTDVYALGLQYKATDKLKLHAGYNYSKSPIRNAEVVKNIFTPYAIQEHNFGTGTVYDLTDKLAISGVFQYSVPRKQTGHGDTSSNVRLILKHAMVFQTGLIWKF